MPPPKFFRLPYNVILSMIDEDDLESMSMYELYGSDFDEHSDSDKDSEVMETAGNEDLAPEMLNNDIQVEHLEEPFERRGLRQKKRD